MLKGREAGRQCISLVIIYRTIYNMPFYTGKGDLLQKFKRPIQGRERPTMNPPPSVKQNRQKITVL